MRCSTCDGPCAPTAPARSARGRRAAGVLALSLVACAARAPVERVEARPAEITFAWSGEADAVWVVGTMTGWERVPLAREGTGRFAAALPVAPGRHEYRLEVEVGGGVAAALPDGAERVADGYGGENALLRVGGR